MFASIYHARVFLCVYINSRKIASVCSAREFVARSFREVLSVGGGRVHLRGRTRSRWIDTVDAGKEWWRNPRQERVYFTPTLFYTVLHPGSVLRGNAIFKDTGGKRSHVVLFSSRTCFYVQKQNETPSSRGRKEFSS